MINFETAPFKFEVIADELPHTSPGIKITKPTGVTIHHSAVVASENYDFKARLAVYAKGHLELSGGLAYTFAIGMENSDKIYICRYFDYHQWHNSNGVINPLTRGILVDGDFTKQNPTELQLKKLRFLLDVLAENGFSANGWANILDGINPKDNNKVISGNGRSVKTLHWHNEAAEQGYGTACCGTSLMPYINDYRANSGNITWGKYIPDPTPTPQPQPQPEPQPEPEKITLLKSDYDALITSKTNAEKERDDYHSKWNSTTDAYQKYVTQADFDKELLRSQLTQAQNYGSEQKQKADEMEQRALKAEQTLNEIGSQINTSGKFWAWLYGQARQLRYFITNGFWSLILLVLSVIPQVAVPNSDIAIWISSHWGFIGTIIIAFFSQSAVQAYFKNKQEEVSKQEAIAKTLKA